ncbi:hypothetical protein GCM10022290_18590 [Sagittula marina]
MRGGSGLKLSVQLQVWRARGLTQRIHRIKHPVFDLGALAHADAVDTRQWPPVRSDSTTARRCGSGGACCKRSG